VLTGPKKALSGGAGENIINGFDESIKRCTGKNIKKIPSGGTGESYGYYANNNLLDFFRN
jgi:hypothetical protein